MIVSVSQSTISIVLLLIHSIQLCDSLYPSGHFHCAYKLFPSIVGNTTVSILFHQLIELYHHENTNHTFVGCVIHSHAVTPVVSAEYFFVVVVVLHPFELYIMLHASAVLTNQFEFTQHLHG